MKNLVLSTFLFLTCFLSAKSQFDLQGHRGCRGLLPENTIPAFIRAVDLGATTLELDVVITRDLEVLVSHDHYLSALICKDSKGQTFPREREKEFNLFTMDLEEIRKCDCGSNPHPDFPGQERVKASKPLLNEVFEAVQEHLKKNGLKQVQYNIEIKSSESGDNVYHPQPAPFTHLVLEVIARTGMKEHIMIQSFDFRILQYLHKTHPEIKTAVLIANARSFESNLKTLGYRPEIYSPNHLLVSRKLVRKVHAAGMKLIPWTVNQEKDMARLIGWKVDGIITDYPDRLARQL